jgi:hypothetical protein
MVRIALFLLLAGSLAIVSQVKGQSLKGGEQAGAEQIYLINDGDSLLGVYGSSTRRTSMTFAVPLVEVDSLRAVNTSIPGEKLWEMVSNFSTSVATKYDSRYKTFIVHSLGGGNDIRDGASVANVYALLQSYVNAVHALGPNAIALVATYPLQCDIFNSATRMDRLQSYNKLIYAGWNRPQSAGGLDADGLVDYFADPTVGANTYSSSAFCSVEWSKDGQHLNDAGKAIMGRIEANVIARFLAIR